MADGAQETGHLSIGEVLGLLLAEFPDVTISKIRFLESQGLISPERTPSGYRKFHQADVDLLRVILTEQRQNYLPLRVIKDRLETGEIDPTGEHLQPSANGDAGVRSSDDDHHDDDHHPDDDRHDHADDHRHDVRHEVGNGDPTPVEVPATSIASHPAARGTASNHNETQDTPAPDTPAPDTPAPDTPAADTPAPDTPAPDTPAADTPAPDTPAADTPAPAPEPPAAPPPLLPGVLLDRDEFCGMVGITPDELDQLESFGIVHPRPTGGSPVYDEDAVAVATPAVEFLRAGIDARHLRNWRTSAEREASLYEQIVTPRFRQRNPEARAEALRQLDRLDALGASLRGALTRQALRHHFDT